MSLAFKEENYELDHLWEKYDEESLLHQLKHLYQLEQELHCQSTPTGMESVLDWFFRLSPTMWEITHKYCLLIERFTWKMSLFKKLHFRLPFLWVPSFWLKLNFLSFILQYKLSLFSESYDDTFYKTNHWGLWDMVLTDQNGFELFQLWVS